MIALVCDTPYQLMSAILVAGKVAPEEELVFFINTYLYFKEQQFSYSDEHPRIHKILYYGKKHMGAVKLVGGLINPLHMLRHISGYREDMRFRAIITSRTTYMATYLYNRQKKENIPVYLIEEGIGEYTGNMVHTRFTKACAMLGQKTHLDHITCAYFSAPGLYPYKTPFAVEKIPAMDGSARELIESMFGVAKLSEGANRLDAYPCILLSEPNKYNMKNPDDAQAYEQRDFAVMDAVAQAAGGNLIIKVHPVDPDFQKEGIETFYTKLPMETLLLSMHTQQKCFVSPTSTAMLTPKLLFDMEPTLVFTYKLLDAQLQKHLSDDALRHRYYRFIEGVMAMYRDQQKVHAPATVEELQKIIEAHVAAYG